MRRLVVFVLITIGVVFAGASLFAGPQNDGGYEVKGTITDIKPDNLNFTIKDEANKSHLIKASDSKILEGLKVGDSVNVKLENEKAVLIQKLEGDGPVNGGGYGN